MSVTQSLAVHGGNCDNSFLYANTGHLAEYLRFQYACPCEGVIKAYKSLALSKGGHSGPLGGTPMEGPQE